MKKVIWVDQKGKSLASSDISDVYLARILVFVGNGGGNALFLGNRFNMAALFLEGKNRFPDLLPAIDRIERFAKRIFHLSKEETFEHLHEPEIKSAYFTANPKKEGDSHYSSCLGHIRNLFNIALINEEEATKLVDLCGFTLINLNLGRYTGTLGNPKYKYEDVVTFALDGKEKTGSVFVVDAFGTFDQNIEPSYDILVHDENILYKHIRETFVISKAK